VECRKITHSSSESFLTQDFACLLEAATNNGSTNDLCICT
jgi:hypothetical protein